ncbi:MAG: hypothetical protein ABEK17_01610 [Candidatus Aenigmatarchaeota archaeon]
MGQGYSPEIAWEIWEKIHRKGWNLYRTTHQNQLNAANEPEKTIRNNLSESPKVNEKYVMLPSVDDPTNPNQVMRKLESLAQKRNREMPTIDVDYESHPLSGFTLKEDSVKIHTPKGTVVSYFDFAESIDSLVQIDE